MRKLKKWHHAECVLAHTDDMPCHGWVPASAPPTDHGGYLINLGFAESDDYVGDRP